LRRDDVAAAKDHAADDSHKTKPRLAARLVVHAIESIHGCG
jgi:hypothetical protein